jgi:uncharacterized protein
MATSDRAVRRDVQFESGGEACAAWHYRPASEQLSGAAGAPCVIMAPGLAATRDCGFEPYAHRLAAAGSHVLLFDYRGFGDSGGEPRQVVHLAGQRRDYGAAIDYAAQLDAVDESRIVLWGHSLSGGHVLQVAAEDKRVGGVISLAPSADARASMALAIRGNGLLTTARALAAGARDARAALAGREPITIPVTGPRGSTALLASGYARQGYARTAGPRWRNQVAARLALTIGQYRPVRSAGQLTCPTLIQVADEDTMASTGAAMRAAWLARADVRHYPCDHMDVLGGQPWLEQAADHQVHFLTHRLGVRSEALQDAA